MWVFHLIELGNKTLRDLKWSVYSISVLPRKIGGDFRIYFPRGKKNNRLAYVFIYLEGIAFYAFR